jgi:hypothetical protein
LCACAQRIEAFLFEVDSRDWPWTSCTNHDAKAFEVGHVRPLDV